MDLSKSRYIYYNPPLINRLQLYDLPGMKNFANIYKFLPANLVAIDRSGVIKVPIRTEILQKIPKFRMANKSYGLICDERATSITKISDTHNLPIYVFYSGGIDSTLIIVSLLKNATSEQLSRVVILMTRESVHENPVFFEKYIRGKFRIEMATTYPFILGKKAIFISGECNDQLFGSDLLKRLIDNVGGSALHAKYHRDVFHKLWGNRSQDPKDLNAFLDLLERQRASAPIPIETNAEALWWMNFTLKWQAVSLRMLSYSAAHVQKFIDQSYFKNYFFNFYDTEDFQLWSMNNKDRKINDTWKSYKLDAKQEIFNFTHDSDYLKEKTKLGSLLWVIRHQRQANFIDSNWNFSLQQDVNDWYEPENDFI